MAVLVFADSANGALAKSGLEATSYASKLATQLGTNCIALTHGQVSNAADLGNYGATKVLVATGTPTSKLVAEAAAAEDAEVVVISNDYTGKSIAPGVSARMNAGMVTGAIELPDTSNGFTVKKSAFSGKAFANVAIKSAKKVITVTPNSVGAEETGGTTEVTEYSGDSGTTGITIKEVKAKGTGGILLTEADLVVSGGRGLKGPENWGLVEDLANTLGAATACSRPVADVGWRPHHEHVGQTGIAVRPTLYIAIGISGAIQHLAGVNQSKVMVVINTDAEAPFFKAADYGIVGDAFEVVPKLTEAIKNFKAANN